MMEFIFYTILSFLFGLCIGSFLNVVALRLNTGFSLEGRSQCFSCGKKLSWYELIPLVSFMVQKGKCTFCKSRISFQYPLVEFVTGIVFSLIAWRLFVDLAISPSFSSIFFTVFFFLLFSILIIITVYDLRHTIIPNVLVYSFISLSFFLSLIRFFDFFSVGPLLGKFLFIDIGAGILFFLVFAGFWLISSGAWMGFGDAKLVLGMGFLLGFKQGIFALLLSFWAGAVVGIFLLFLRERSFTMKSEIPFAPFLVLGTSISFLFDVPFF